MKFEPQKTTLVSKESVPEVEVGSVNGSAKINVSNPAPMSGPCMLGSSSIKVYGTDVSTISRDYGTADVKPRITKL